MRGALSGDKATLREPRVIVGLGIASPPNLDHPPIGIPRLADCVLVYRTVLRHHGQTGWSRDVRNHQFCAAVGSLLGVRIRVGRVARRAADEPGGAHPRAGIAGGLLSRIYSAPRPAPPEPEPE